MPSILNLLRIVSGTEDQFISEATVKKSVISEHFDMLATQLLCVKDLDSRS